jgi:hypothetical protein
MRLLSSSKSRIAALLILLGCTMFALVWLQRDRIADHYVQRSLAAKHVRASYRITQVALRTQRIENLVLGDPARPDLVAQSVEVDIGYGLGLPYVANVRVRGARLRGRLDAAGLHLGELDKFRDPGSTAPFHLPDIDLTLDDAGARIETPLGPVGLTVSGSGNLQSGFAGKIAALMRDVSTNGCATPRLTAYLDVAMRDGAPRLSGPVRASALGCGGARNNAVTLAEVALKTDVVLSSALDGWKGTVGGEARAIGGSGVLASRPRLAIRFEGQAQQMALDGTLEADAVTASALNLAGLRASARSAASTPLGPLLSQLAEGVGALQRNNQLHAAFALDRQRSGTHLAVTALELKGEKQSRIALGRGWSHRAVLARYALDDAGRPRQQRWRLAGYGAAAESGEERRRRGPDVCEALRGAWFAAGAGAGALHRRTGWSDPYRDPAPAGWPDARWRAARAGDPRDGALGAAWARGEHGLCAGPGVGAESRCGRAWRCTPHRLPVGWRHDHAAGGPYGRRNRAGRDAACWADGENHRCGCPRGLRAIG